jgi:hypothetical protein
MTYEWYQLIGLATEYTAYHAGFLSSRPNWVPHHLTPFGSKGVAHSVAFEGVEIQIPTKRQIPQYSILKSIYGSWLPLHFRIILTFIYRGLALRSIKQIWAALQLNFWHVRSMKLLHGVKTTNGGMPCA